MGVEPSNNIKGSKSLMNHIKILENEGKIKINNNNNIFKKNINKVVDNLITKIENNVCLLNEKIKTFNQEKKELSDLNNKEVESLKKIIRKLYMTIVTINKSIDLKHSNRVDLLEKLRKEINSNEGLKKSIDQIMTGTFINMRDGHDLTITNIIEDKREKIEELNDFYKNLKSNKINSGEKKENTTLINNTPRNTTLNNTPKNTTLNNTPKNTTLNNTPKNTTLRNNTPINTTPRNTTLNNTPKNTTLNTTAINTTLNTTPINNSPKNNTPSKNIKNIREKIINSSISKNNASKKLSNYNL
jgi:hypothetical protein